MQTGKACDETVTGEARIRIEGGLAHFPALAKEQTVSFDDLAIPTVRDRQPRRSGGFFQQHTGT